MTAQISDKIEWNDTEWSISTIENIWPFTPKKAFGLETRMMSTACWRGYYCQYQILENRLRLSELCINVVGTAPDIQGIQAQRNSRRGQTRGVVYKGLSFPVDYSGCITIGSGFKREFYIHMGIQAPHTYSMVFKLCFERGQLIGHEDLSEEMKKQRESMPQLQKTPRRRTR